MPIIYLFHIPTRELRIRSKIFDRYISVTFQTGDNAFSFQVLNLRRVELV